MNDYELGKLDGYSDTPMRPLAELNDLSAYRRGYSAGVAIREAELREQEASTAKR